MVDSTITISNAQADKIYGGFGQPGGTSTTYTAPPPNVILYTLDNSSPANVLSVMCIWTNGAKVFFKHSERYPLSKLLGFFPPVAAGSHFPQYFCAQVNSIN